MKKVTSRRFAKIVIPLIIILVGIVVSASFILRDYARTLDIYYGRGRMHIVNPEGTEHWDTEYYQRMFERADGENGSLAYATKVTKSITDEGIVLLKNNGVLPLAPASKITPMGCRYLYPVYGGVGSGSVSARKENTWSPQQGIENHFALNHEVVQRMKASLPMEMTGSSIGNTAIAGDGYNFTGDRNSLYEFPASIYAGLEAACADTAALVFIGRVAGEGSNLQTTPYLDGTPHALALTQNERQMIAFAKQNCATTVAVINSSNVMEIGILMAGQYECDAILWIGGSGSTGFWSLGDILAGKINPSGRTVDIWDADLLRNPVQANFEDIRYTNTIGIEIASNVQDEQAGLYFIEYQEGIYIGYRYYETAHALGVLPYGGVDGTGKRIAEGAVNYPFGYGLSYASFSQRIVDVSATARELAVTVEIENGSEIDGREVVQIYYSPPYTAFDRQYDVEKASKNLVAFEKVAVGAGQREQVTVTFAKEDMASYCSARPNADGTFGSYFLEQGTYVLTLGKNSHDAWDTAEVVIDKTVWYDAENIRDSDIRAQTQLDDDGGSLGFPKKAMAEQSATYVAASNQFAEVNEYMYGDGVTRLSRSDWRGTQPAKPSPKALDGNLLKTAVSYDPETDPLTGNHDSSLIYKQKPPVQKAEKQFRLSDLRGKDYYDPMWDRLLDQLDYAADDLLDTLLYAAFHTGKIAAIDKPTSVDSDGPQGFRRNHKGMSNAYCTEVIVAASFNTDLAYAYGASIGQEALTFGINGWYGPGLNMHRSPFSGRNYEYYSVDPLLSGKMAARCISGAADQGVISFVKHFALNNYEGPTTCLAVWATEQTIREIYLKSFEIALKEARMTVRYIADREGNVKTKIMNGATGVMAAGNMIGVNWCAANYNLLENVLRGEWGFQGAVITDMALQNTPGIHDRLFRSGSDLRMAFDRAALIDRSSPTALHRFRGAIKNAAYAYANSNLMQGLAPGAIVYYDMSPWAIGLLAANITVYTAAAALILWWLLLRWQEKRASGAATAQADI